MQRLIWELTHWRHTILHFQAEAVGGTVRWIQTLLFFPDSFNFMYSNMYFLFRNLKNNQLTGPIPSTLSQIPNLKTLWDFFFCFSFSVLFCCFWFCYHAVEQGFGTKPTCWWNSQNHLLEWSAAIPVSIIPTSFSVIHSSFNALFSFI